MATVHAIVEFFSELKRVFWKKLSSSKSWYFDIVMLAGVLSLSRLSNHRGKAITVVFALAGLLTLRLATSPRAWDGNAITIVLETVQEQTRPQVPHLNAALK